MIDKIKSTTHNQALARIAHYFTDFVPVDRFIAVYFTVLA